jgi:hypothetical protein
LIDINVDQFTLTLYVNEDEFTSYDEYYYIYIRSRFNKILHLNELFGEPVHLPYGDGWYNQIYDYGFDERHLFFKYNDETIDNQISIVFHAETLKEYLRSYRNKIDSSITVFDLLKKLSTLGVVRLSRLDIAIDLINEQVLVDDMAKAINDYDIVVKNSRDSIIAADSIQQIGSGGRVETMYINKRKSASFLRIYDKKVEVERKESADLKTAIESENWTRIELELKKYYAHNITDLILECETVEQFNKIILSAFLDKFKFLKRAIEDDEKTDNGYIEMTFYKKLKEILNGEITHLMAHKRQRVTELKRKYNNFNNNGTMRLFRMIKEAYGEEGLREVFELINKDCEVVQLNRDHLRFIEQLKNETPFFRQEEEH